MMERLLVVIVIAFAAVGCENPNYCEGNPNNDCRTGIDAAPDETTGCTSSATCTAPTPACDTAASTCVQCIAPNETSACIGASPVCGTDHMCRGCQEHAECGSLTCLADGSCAAESDVAYVSASGSGTACTLASPCPLLADALAKNLPHVKIAAAGAARASSTIVIDGKTVTIHADPGAVLDRDGDGPILEVKSANANVAILDLTISGATSASGDGILLTPNGGSPALALTRVTIKDNQGKGISSSGGSLTVTRSTIATNQGGGISVSGAGATFAITNNFIYRNGNSTTATVGGASVVALGASVFAFNTVVDNQIQNSSALSGGVFCDTSGFTAPNNIIARNFVNNDPNKVNSNTSGLCTYPTSAVATAVTGLAFVSPDDAPHNYRIGTGSTAIDAATTSSSVAVDHDGDARPQGSAKDCGADEYKP